MNVSMEKKFIILLLFLTLWGCSRHIAPENNKDFQRSTELSHIAGTYKNFGDPTGSLSNILWGDEVPHGGIELIQVSVYGKHVVVNAIKNECVFYSQEYIEGKDFKIKQGKITLNKDVAILSRGAGDPLAGPSIHTIELGLDTEGHGKYQSREYLAGLIFMMVPVAGSDTTDIRFTRVKVNKRYDLCKEP